MEGPMDEDIEEADVEMDLGEVPPTGVSAPEQAPPPLTTMLAMAAIWMGSPGSQVAEPGISSRAQGKVPAAQAE